MDIHPVSRADIVALGEVGVDLQNHVRFPVRLISGKLLSLRDRDVWGDIHDHIGADPDNIDGKTHVFHMKGICPRFGKDKQHPRKFRQVISPAKSSILEGGGVGDFYQDIYFTDSNLCFR